MKTTSVLQVSTSPAIIVENAESGKVVKVLTLVISNSTDSALSLDVEIYRFNDSFKIMKGALLPANRSVNIFIGKDFGIFLENGDKLRVFASAAGAEAVCSYEVADHATATRAAPTSRAIRMMAEPGDPIPEEDLTMCPAGPCLGYNWFCCPDNIYCAPTAQDCPSSTPVSSTVVISGVSVLLSDYFGPGAVRLFEAPTGSEMVVPEGANLAVFVDSHGQISTRNVSPGDVLTFRSAILTGNKKTEFEFRNAVGEQFVDSDWYNIANWTVAGEPATVLPGSEDSVVVLGRAVCNPPAIAKNVSVPSGSLSGSLEAESFLFSGLSINEASLTGSVTFSGFSVNQGSVGGAVFTDNSANQGEVLLASFLDESLNSANGTVAVAEFRGDSFNNGSVGSATFYDTSLNEGSLNSGVFKEGTINFGVVENLTLEGGSNWTPDDEELNFMSAFNSMLAQEEDQEFISIDDIEFSTEDPGNLFTLSTLVPLPVSILDDGLIRKFLDTASSCLWPKRTMFVFNNSGLDVSCDCLVLISIPGSTWGKRTVRNKIAEWLANKTTKQLWSLQDAAKRVRNKIMAKYPNFTRYMGLVDMDRFWHYDDYREEVLRKLRKLIEKNPNKSQDMSTLLGILDQIVRLRTYFLRMLDMLDKISSVSDAFGFGIKKVCGGDNPNGIGYSDCTYEPVLNELTCECDECASDGTRVRNLCPGTALTLWTPYCFGPCGCGMEPRNQADVSPWGLYSCGCYCPEGKTFRKCLRGCTYGYDCSVFDDGREVGTCVGEPPSPECTFNELTCEWDCGSSSSSLPSSSTVAPDKAVCCLADTPAPENCADFNPEEMPWPVFVNSCENYFGIAIGTVISGVGCEDNPCGSSSSSSVCGPLEVYDPATGQCVCEYTSNPPRGYCPAKDQIINPETCFCECDCGEDEWFGFKETPEGLKCDCAKPSSSSGSSSSSTSSSSSVTGSSSSVTGSSSTVTGSSSTVSSSSTGACDNPSSSTGACDNSSSSTGACDNSSSSTGACDNSSSSGASSSSSYFVPIGSSGSSLGSSSSGSLGGSSGSSLGSSSSDSLGSSSSGDSSGPCGGLVDFCPKATTPDGREICCPCDWNYCPPPGIGCTPFDCTSSSTENQSSSSTGACDQPSSSSV